MKAVAFLILSVGVLITLDNGTLASGKDEGNWKAFSQPDRKSPAVRVRATKTEYVEVTRRQTMHPVCYTAYEAKAPCLPYSQSDFQEEDYYDGPEVEAQRQTEDSFQLNEVKRAGQAEYQTTEQQNDEGSNRAGRYLEVKLRRTFPETSTRIEGSEFFPTPNRVQPQQSVEYHTKTVLITKLEKYTDRRVTATLLAVNCLPVDRSIPMCQTHTNPIKESPDRRSDNLQEGSYNPTSAGFGDLESGVTKSESGDETKAIGVVESTETNTEDTLLGEE